MNQPPMEESTDLASFSYLFTTYSTQKFLPSLDIWLNTTVPRLNVMKATIRVYIGADVNDGQLAELRAKWSSVTFTRLPAEVPAGAFADYWAAEHYAWKIWIMKTLSDEFVGDANKIVMYWDAGAVMTRMPEEMIRKALRAGACFIEDTTQKNMYWFSESFKQILSVKEFELYSNQILGGIWTLYPSKSRKLADMAFEMSKNRGIIAGPKWAGVNQQGQPFGHRHDQSILSLLRLRLGVPSVLIDDVHSMESLEAAHRTGKHFYVHRGNFVSKKDVLKNISDVIVINLKRREDRLDKFFANHPDLHQIASVHDAVDGKTLTLTPAIARLMRPNDFFWKKAVMGCALSHLGLWYKLANERPDVNSYLILEDDAKLMPSWQTAWNRVADSTPANWDVLYLGGVLPPNWKMYDSIKERVAGPWCRVAPNQLFGQKTPTRYFHFCAYAYVLSKRGAQKLLKIIEARDGYFTSADHMICNHVDVLNMYFLDPKLATCIQEEDPNYLKADFNNFSRIDTFDSDLWTNDERWSVEERNAALNSSSSTLDIRQALLDTVNSTAAAPMPAPAPVPAPASVPAPAPAQQPLIVRMLNGSEDGRNNIMEIEWLEELMGRKLRIEPMPRTSAELLPNEKPWVIVSRQDLNTWEHIFRVFSHENRDFRVIHIGDEFGKDSVDWYKNPNCKYVVRFYERPEVSMLPTVLTLPLGYAVGAKCNETVSKDLTWYFEGTSWFNRKDKLAPLEANGPHVAIYHNGWNSKTQKSRASYARELKRAHFIPCPAGNSIETFRVYEALEAGSIPLYVTSGDNDVYFAWISKYIPLLPIKSWTEASQYVSFFMSNKGELDKYRGVLLNAWADAKRIFRDKLAKNI